MNINKQKLAVILLAVLMLLCLGACGTPKEMELPPLPTYSDETPKPTESPSPSASASPTPTPAATAPVAASVSPKPVETTVPSPLPTVESDVPVISITEETLPSDMLQYNVADLRGVVSVDKGYITNVTASLMDEEGTVVQSCYFQPVVQKFSLAGTVNAELQFGILQPGTYFYVLTADADYNGKTVQSELIYHRFNVYATQEQLNLGAADGSNVYTAKISTDSSNAAVIWNFLIVYLDNPYGAAGVLANIEVESGCDPTRVQGDFSDDHSYSQYYTQLVDECNVNRDSFIWTLPGDSYGSGYGLCQWTLDRKEGLYDLAQEQGTSIGDLDTQCTYLIMELEMNYPQLSKSLKNATDAREAARDFFYAFEQGSAMGNRPGIAEDFLEQFAT